MTTGRAAVWAIRCPAPSARSVTPDRDRHWNPRAAGAPSHQECALCRQPALRSGRSSTAIQRCAPTSVHHRLLLLLLLLLTRAVDRPYRLRLLLLLLLG